MLENMVDKALETAMSHEDMTVVINANLENLKNLSTWSFTEDEAMAMTAITLVYFAKHPKTNPYQLFKVLKSSQFDFKGLYKPLNTISTDGYLAFLNGEFKISKDEDKEVTKEAKIIAGDVIALWHNEEFTYMCVDEVNENGTLDCYSRKYGQIDISPIDVRKVDENSKEYIVAQAEYLHSNGETIYLLDGNGEKLLHFIPVSVNGKLHILNKDTYAIESQGFESLIHLMKYVVDNLTNIGSVEVL